MRTPQSDPEYLARLQDYFARWKTIPSYERLCVLWGLASRSAAGKVLERLRRAEFLERTPDGAWVPAGAFSSDSWRGRRCRRGIRPPMWRRG